MADNKMLFPLKAGLYKYFTKAEFNSSKFYQYGVYNCAVSNVDTRLFKINKSNWYTHIDLNRAKELKADIEIIENANQKSNAMIYARDKLIQGHYLFGDFVSYLFSLKQSCKNDEEKDAVKMILNCLWGALVKKNVVSLNTNGETEIYGNKEIESIQSRGDNKYYVKLINRDSYYETEFARIKPFLLAKARGKLSKIMESNINSIVWCHTDGLIASKKLDIKLGIIT